MTSVARPTVSAESLRCRSVIPSKHSTSSRDIGWTSLLVDVHSGMAWNRPYAAVTTLDPRIGVSFSGEYLIHFFSRGAWRADVNRPGMTTVLRVEDDRRFSFTPLQEDECRFALVYFPLEQLAAAADHFRRPGQRLAIPSFNQVQVEDRAITEVTRSVIRAMEAGADELYADTVSAWLATHVLVQERAAPGAEDTRRDGELSDGRLRRVVEFIAVHFAERITLEQLAAEAGISKFHFARLFRDKLGQTPFRFLAETRLAAARKMLVTTDMRVTEIALACGYAAASHFTTAFSAKYGTSPADFRAAHES